MTVFDAHAHAGDAAEIAARRLEGVRTMLSCGNPAQAAQGEALAADSPVFSLTAGVHPWYAQDVRPAQMLPYMERAALVGEIGLDSVWCTTPMKAQRAAFSAQLDWAAAHGKGIVLHTKGMEEEIARAVEGFPHPVVVHWYSGAEDALARFLSMGCYFTIGPDVTRNPAVQAVARLVPKDRLLLETDGMDAVRWALESDAPQSPRDALLRSARAAAQLRGQSPDSIIQNANGNFCRLLSR